MQRIVSYFEIRKTHYQYLAQMNLKAGDFYAGQGTDLYRVRG